jgi:radical SAM superfamily enzyme YgiQ (UPF0313 family)
MGGIHASMCSDEALQRVDAVVIGGAETAWPQLIADFEAGRQDRIYRGEWTDLQNTPRSRRDLFHSGYRFASVQTSRGCPLDCEFCSVTAFNGRRYRRRPPEDVLAELESIPQPMVLFVDDNIIGYSRDSRDRAVAIFRGMVERGLNKVRLCQASLNFADDEEVLHWAGRAGCKMVFLGLEAEEAEALRGVNKRLNLKMGVSAYEGSFLRIQRAGIAVLGAFIFGLDGDTPGRVHHRAGYMIRSGIDVMQGTALTPLPGTRPFEAYRQGGRLLHADFPRDWDRYDMTEVVHRPQAMTPECLVQEIGTLNRRMYAWPVLAGKAARTLWRTRDIAAAMFAWGSNVNYRNVTRGRRRAG